MHHFQFVRYRFVFETPLQADIQLMPCRERTDQALQYHAKEFFDHREI